MCIGLSSAFGGQKNKFVSVVNSSRSELKTEEFILKPTDLSTYINEKKRSDILFGSLTAVSTAALSPLWGTCINNLVYRAQ